MIYLILIIQQLIASGTHIVAKNLTINLNESIIILLRAIISSSIYLIWIIFNKKNLLKIDKKDYLLILILGLLNIPLNQYIFFISIKFTTPPNVALAYALSPVFVSVISFFYLKEKLSKLKILGISISMIGSILLLLEKGLNFDSKYFLGNLLALLASFSWALYTIYGKKLSEKYGPIYTMALSMIGGLLLFMPIYIIIGNFNDVSLITKFDFLNLLYVGVLTSVVGYALWYYALTKLQASNVAIFNNLQPILTTILSLIIFNQQITHLFIIGGLFVMIGVLITQRS